MATFEYEASYSRTGRVVRASEVMSEPVVRDLFGGFLIIGLDVRSMMVTCRDGSTVCLVWHVSCIGSVIAAANESKGW